MIPQVKDIPTVGYDGFLTSYISAWKFLVYAQEIIKEGCDKVLVGFDS